MEDLFLGTLSFTICLLCFAWAWHNAQKGNYAIAITLIVFSGLVLRVFVASDLYLHEWDERFHALVAKHLSTNPFVPTLYENPILPFDYRYWASSHIWLHKQPFPLWTMALSLKIVGFNEFALRLPSILLSTIAIWLTYRIASYLFNNKIGLLAAALHAIHGLTIELTGGRVATDHIDLFFLFFVELGVFFCIYFLQKPKWIFSLLIGSCMGCAILSKWLPALIILPIWLSLCLDKKIAWSKLPLHFFLILLAAIIVALPWQWYILHTFPVEAKWSFGFNVKHIFEDLDGNGKPWYYHLNKMRRLYGELIYLPIIWFIYEGTKRSLRGEWNYFALIIWIGLPYLFFSCVRTKMQGYTLFTAPAFFMIIAFSVDLLWQSKYKRKWHLYLSRLFIFLLLIFPIGYSIERTKLFAQTERLPIWTKELKALEFDNNEKVVLFNVEHPIEAMFYKDLTAYQEQPSPFVLDSLIIAGYSVYICEKHAQLNCKKQKLSE